MVGIKGIVRGRTIELEENHGLPEGEEVTVTVRRLLAPGEGIGRSAGAWADVGEELDAWLEQVYVDRGHDRAETRERIASLAKRAGCLALCLLLSALAPSCFASESSPLKHQPKITISKETTYILGPLRPDGYPDYLAALNEHCSRGVTVENNAAVSFWQAVGPEAINKSHREQVFRLLGIGPLPDEGVYLESFYRFATRFKGWKEEDGNTPEDRLWQKRYQQVDVAKRRPWSADEFPVVAAWLKANEKPLELLVQATRRPRFYTPLVDPDGGSLLRADFGASMQGSRLATELLLARSMYRLRIKDVDGAAQDLMACHRLARLMGQGPFVIDQLCASAFEGMACPADAVFLHCANAKIPQVRKFREELGQLPPLLHMAETCDFGERLFSLWAVSSLPRGDAKDVKLWLQWQEKRDQELMAKLIADPSADWNTVLRVGNQWIDRLVAAWRGATPAARNAALDRLAEAARALGSPASGRSAKALSSTQQISELAVKQMIIGLANSAYMDGRIAALWRLRETAFALAEYRQEHASYPAALSDLVPRYTSEFPRDPFANQDMHYRRQGKGYVLYSVGRNGKDDGGKNALDSIQEWIDETDPKKIPQWDDIVIRTPEEDK